MDEVEQIQIWKNAEEKLVEAAKWAKSQGWTFEANRTNCLVPDNQNVIGAYYHRFRPSLRFIDSVFGDVKCPDIETTVSSALNVDEEFVWGVWYAQMKFGSWVGNTHFKAGYKVGQRLLKYWSSEK